ncbi:bifunctional 4-hydroxy-2-oxoglutarate aldolase/2-dehydro-3-deoxy-phosphogluconate aldolase [Streptomyces sp. NRRL F-5123]|uniref:bifunctional 4-hydroxy-2-oxoglutarate aldolase/2-dehydro-3-deoxy-phosphogluconate aldolase n=1 Tax=Streptomyces sp. NRRL F-5123 TaxID=1463856 RepID=UPI00069378CF|nr:bifunctional 4-hydroxy-2-oxoglutarate aldolase/2-dehydro-3-deoxy-phosphogluconate aldolase [Streptomyces sp. NRRL F-5123]
MGAGTVTTVERVRQAAGAGASFAVAPGLDPGVAAVSLGAGLPYLPGVATASDIRAAGRLGLRKGFPASALGAGWVTMVHGPFPRAQFVATGGVGAANARRLPDAGARSSAGGPRPRIAPTSTSRPRCCGNVEARTAVTEPPRGGRV